ncbi:MAG TPA: hypothetical protein VIC33_16600 [Vicinamibacterales bacterium]|jgi:hypothetical protein
MKDGVEIFTRKRLIALGLWLVLAIIIWNTLFDDAVNSAAHRYIVAAVYASRGQGPTVSMDAIMQPAIVHGAWLATGCATLVLAIGVAGVAWSIWQEQRRAVSAPQTQN